MVFNPGGHGPLWDLVEDKKWIALIEAFYNAGKLVAAVCHQGRAVPRGGRTEASGWSL
jgi:putative intracellular protease/amidase